MVLWHSTYWNTWYGQQTRIQTYGHLHSTRRTTVKHLSISWFFWTCLWRKIMSTYITSRAGRKPCLCSAPAFMSTFSMVPTYGLGLLTFYTFDKSDFNEMIFRCIIPVMIITEQPVFILLQKCRYKHIASYTHKCIYFSTMQYLFML